MPLLTRIASVALCLAGAATVTDACESYDAVVAAVTAEETEEARRLHDVIATDPACDDALRGWVGTYLAQQEIAFAIREAPDAASKRAALRRALGYERHWRSLAELGRMDWEEKDWSAAAQNFQLAINELVEGNPDHAAETHEIAELYDLAAASVALADEAVELPKTRSGTSGGILATSIRGFVVEEVPLPITFAFDSTEFDPKGRAYADRLAEHLLSMEAGAIHLDGHTDPLGEEDYNLGLSRDRAAALRDFLKQQGVAGEIEIAGLGEAEIPPPPPGIEPGSEEHYRLARRVTLRLD